MTEPQNIGIVLSLLGAVGWVFKVWIITPLNMSVDRLNDSLSRIEGIIDNIQRKFLLKIIEVQILKSNSGTSLLHSLF